MRLKTWAKEISMVKTKLSFVIAKETLIGIAMSFAVGLATSIALTLIVLLLVK